MDTIEINLNYYRLLGLYLGSRSGARLLRRGRRLLLLGFLFFAFFFLLLGAFLLSLTNFVTAWTKRGLRIFSQSDKVNALHIEINVLKFVLGKGRLEVTPGSEEQIFAVVAKSDVTRTVPFIRHCGPLLIGQRVNVNSR